MSSLKGEPIAVFLRECRNPPGGIGAETAVAPKPRRSTAAARNARASWKRTSSLSSVGFISEGVSAFTCTCVFQGEKVYGRFKNLFRRSTQRQRMGLGSPRATICRISNGSASACFLCSNRVAPSRLRASPPDVASRGLQGSRGLRLRPPRTCSACRSSPPEPANPLRPH